MPNIAKDPSFWADLLQRVIRRTRDRANAEDFLHTAFIRLEHYRTMNKVDNPVAFLVQSAANIAVDRHRHENFVVPQGVDALAFDMADSAPLQDEVLAARERLKRVRQGLKQLSPKTREIFLMHRIDGQKYREIAARLDISQSAVEKHIAKAALFLTNWMEGW